MENPPPIARMGDGLKDGQATHRHVLGCRWGGESNLLQATGAKCGGCFMKLVETQPNTQNNRSFKIGDLRKVNRRGMCLVCCGVGSFAFVWLGLYGTKIMALLQTVQGAGPAGANWHCRGGVVDLWPLRIWLLPSCSLWDNCISEVGPSFFCLIYEDFPYSSCIDSKGIGLEICPYLLTNRAWMSAGRRLLHLARRLNKHSGSQ